MLLGAHKAGKTTVCVALYIAHPHRFPQLPQPSAAVLGDTPRATEVNFEFEKDGYEGPFGESLLAQSQPPPRWSRSPERSFGSVRAVEIEDGHHVDETHLIYLQRIRTPYTNWRGARPKFSSSYSAPSRTVGTDIGVSPTSEGSRPTSSTDSCLTSSFSLSRPASRITSSRSPEE